MVEKQAGTRPKGNPVRRFWARLGMSRQLIIGFCLIMLVAPLAFLFSVTALMQQRMSRSLDNSLQSHARSFRTLFKNEQDLLEDQAVTAAHLEGLSGALASGDRAALQRLLTPIKASHASDSVYVLDPGANVLVLLGDPIMPESDLHNIAPVQHAITSAFESAPLQVDGGLWLAGVAPHESAAGKVDAVILVGEHIDQPLLASFQQTLGPQLAVVYGQTAVYSFPQVPAELPIAHLTSPVPSGETQPGGLVMHDMLVGGQPYRVAAFDLSSSPNARFSVWLFQPTSMIVDAVSQARLDIGLITLLVLLLGCALVYHYARSVTRPLEQLTVAAKSIASGDLERSLQSTDEGEVGQLARAFEDMRVRVRAMLQVHQTWNEQLEETVQARTKELESLGQVRDRLLQGMLDAQEEERRRIARELHDETCQSLTALLANIATARRLPAEPTYEQLDSLRSSIVRTLDEVNRIVLDLRPTLLDDYGLIPALSWYAGQRLSSDTDVETCCYDPEARLTREIETVLFRIGQEAISNAAKYAGATHLGICLLGSQSGAPEVCLEIEDNGRGFDPEGIEPFSKSGRRGLGLAGMQERVRLVNGRLEIRSAPGEGTRIAVTVPIPTLALAESQE